jgi:hypothetical protein
MIEKKIVWEKWIDPLNSNVDEVEYPGHDFPSPDLNKGIEFLSLDPNFEEKFEEQMGEDDGYEDSEHAKRITYNPTRIVQTPHGFISLTEHSFASKHFDFWTLHYTHDITEKILNKVEKCPGVETINAMTRYRMRVGFNRPLIQAGAMDLNQIRKNIEQTILSIDEYDSLENLEDKLLFFTEDVVEKVIEVKKNLSGDWAIYIFPNGKIETHCADENLKENKTNSSKILTERISFFNQIKSMIGGEILTSRES